MKLKLVFSLLLSSRWGLVREKQNDLEKKETVFFIYLSGVSNFAILVYTGKERQMWVSAHSIRSWGHQRPPQSLSTAAGVGSPRALLEHLVSPKWGPCPWTSSAVFSVSNWPASLCWSPWWWWDLSCPRSGMSATFYCLWVSRTMITPEDGEPLAKKEALSLQLPLTPITWGRC